jgi:hypothetical protein
LTVLSSCTLFLYLVAPELFAANYERDESIFVFPAVPQDSDIDYSFSVTGNVACVGVIRYEYIPNKPFASFREPLEPPLDDGILAAGIFQNLKSYDNVMFIYIPAKSNQAKGWPEIHWTRYEYEYVWEGEIVNGTAQEAKLDIYVYAVSNSGFSRKAVLKSAKMPSAEMEFNNYISTADVVHEIPPYYWGRFISISSGAEYKLYAVVEDNYYARYPGFKQRERRKTGSSRVDSLAKFFLKQGQKFQLVDKSDVVVSEIYGNTYMLYDTLPESEWEAMKQNIGMFYVYRLIARALFLPDRITDDVYF